MKNCLSVIVVVIIGVLLFNRFNSSQSSTDDLSNQISTDNLSQSSPFNSVEDNLLALVYSDGTVEIVNSDGEKLVLTMKSDEFFSYTSSFDGSMMITSDGDSKIYLIKDLIETEIEIDENASNLEVSDDGSYIAYAEYDDGDWIIYHGCISSGELIKVDDVEGVLSELILSPDGKTLAYSVNDGGYVAYIATFGKDAEVFEEGISIVAVSDNAEYVYYVDSIWDTFYVKTGKNAEKLTGNKSYIDGMAFNADYSELIYSVNGTLYLSVEGGAKEELGSGEFKEIIAPREEDLLTYNSGAFRYNIKSLSGIFVWLDTGIAYINEKHELEIFEDVDVVQLLSDCSSIIYQDGNDFLQYNANNLEEPTQEYEGEGNITKWVASDDGEMIYFLNDDYELYCTVDEEEPMKIADKVRDIVMIPGTATVFFLSDYVLSGVLYYSKNGQEKVMVDGGDSVVTITIHGDEIIYLANEDTDNCYEVYTLNSDAESILIAQNVLALK